MNQAVFEGHKTYRVRGVGLAAVVAVGVAALTVVAVAALFWAATISIDATGELDTAFSLERTALLADVGFSLAQIAALVLTIVWLWRARKNLDAFPDTTPFLSAGWAIGGWFFPLANLFVPGRMMANVARQSSRDRSVTAAAITWWFSLVISMFLRQLASVMSGDTTATLPDYYRNLAVAETVAAVAGVIAAATFAFAVIRISAAQDERIHRGWYEEQHRLLQASTPPATPTTSTDSVYAPGGASPTPAQGSPGAPMADPADGPAVLSTAGDSPHAPGGGAAADSARASRGADAVG
ncbi:DUF4328 domain-containing protein [Asanoa iriomotensis]|uniref:DUF4328 domain-containing protein n=1 Tax=Asanoa iriomotensis TaxID=234613 RepID=A0ABQ4BVI3_9ACTN|nr:DUF4328 domain-containing protein [Asanoa iriomotensis]GIF54534.1 hypothetical protein Air01nite_06290 [Asanoa iriomotensis]